MSCEYISVRKLDYYVNNPNAVIIDLRSQDEYAKEHILKAINIPYNQMEELLNQTHNITNGFSGYDQVNRMAQQSGLNINGRQYDRDQLFVLYCERGSLSLSICSKMGALGFTAKTVIGGISQYQGRYLVH